MLANSNIDLVWFLIAFAVLVTSIIVVPIILRQLNKTTDKDGDSDGPDRKEVELFSFNPITWNLIFRPLAGVTLGTLYTLLLFVVVWSIATYFDREMSIPFAAWIAVALIVGSLGILTEGGEPEDVPETLYFAMVTFLGIPLGRLVRSTGKYRWTGKRLGLGRTKKKTREFTDSDGYIIAGEIPFTVWDRADTDKDGKPDTTIKAPAKNRALISATLILVLQIRSPRPMLNSNNPELDIGEAARQEFREMVGNFVDTDLQHLQQHTIDVLRGQELITCFLPESTYGQKAGGMIHDKGGKVMFWMLERKLTKEQREEKIEEFKSHIKVHAKEHMLELVMKDGDIRVDRVKVEKPIENVVEGLGFDLVRGTFGDIILSEKVTNTAAEASSEPDQRIIRIESAKANKAARKELLRDDEETNHPLNELAMVLEAAADDKSDSISVTMVPGSDNITRAAVAGAKQLKKRGDKS